MNTTIQTLKIAGALMFAATLAGALSVAQAGGPPSFVQLLNAYQKAYSTFEAYPNDSEAQSRAASLTMGIMSNVLSPGTTESQYRKKLARIDMMASQAPTAVSQLLFAIQSEWSRRYGFTYFHQRDTQMKAADLFVQVAFGIGTGVATSAAMGAKLPVQFATWKHFANLRKIAGPAGFVATAGAAAGAHRYGQAMINGQWRPVLPPPAQLVSLGIPTNLDALVDERVSQSSRACLAEGVGFATTLAGLRIASAGIALVPDGRAKLALKGLTYFVVVPGLGWIARNKSEEVFGPMRAREVKNYLTDATTALNANRARRTLAEKRAFAQAMSDVFRYSLLWEAHDEFELTKLELTRQERLARVTDPRTRRQINAEFRKQATPWIKGRFKQGDRLALRWVARDQLRTIGLDPRVPGERALLGQLFGQAHFDKALVAEMRRYVRAYVSDYAEKKVNFGFGTYLAKLDKVDIARARASVEDGRITWRPDKLLMQMALYLKSIGAEPGNRLAADYADMTLLPKVHRYLAMRFALPFLEESL